MMQTPDSQDTPNGSQNSDLAAVALTFGWVITVVLFFVLIPAAWQSALALDSLGTALLISAALMPVALIWVAAYAARMAKRARAETQHLQAALASLSAEKTADQQTLTPLDTSSAGSSGASLTIVETEPTKEIERSASQEDPSESSADPIPVTKADAKPVATGGAPLRAAPRPARSSVPRRPISRLIKPQLPGKIVSGQTALPLGGTSEQTAPPIDNADLIRALNFPDHEGDEEGFAALRRALKDRNARHLVQASQDVLTLLSQDGTYMDDLQPDAPAAELWRRFARGERGRSIDRFGGVRERRPLEQAATRMREDTVFRDAVLHFMRRFDQMLVAFEENSSNADLIGLADTRTARAFMLLGRATGTFD